MVARVLYADWKHGEKLQHLCQRSPWAKRATHVNFFPFMPISSPLCLLIYTFAEWFLAQWVAHGAPPSDDSVLKPNVQNTDLQRVQLREDEYRSIQQIYYNKRHQTRALTSLTTGQQVWVWDHNQEAQILGATKQPMSYLVKTEVGTVRRNRSAIVSTS